MGGIVNPANGEGGLGVIGGQVEFWGGLTQKPSVSDLSDSCAILSRTEQEDGSILPLIDLVGSTYPVGSVAYKLLRVASGHDHLTISIQHKSEWDICGGVALLEAAGKVYRRFDHEPMRFNQTNTRIRSGAVAGDKAIVDQLMAALATQPEMAEWSQPA
jgi:myo-inositol-1(or 4)-monophosphatase